MLGLIKSVEIEAFALAQVRGISVDENVFTVSSGGIIKNNPYPHHGGRGLAL